MKIVLMVVGAVLIVMLAGCGGSGEDASAGPTPPVGGGDTLEIGPLVVQTEKTGGFKAESLAANSDCIFVALYGAQINYLASTAMLDRVVFSRNKNIFRCNLDGSGMTQLTNNGATEGCPRWSPDGTKIVFQRQWTGNNPVICTMNADGTGAMSLTSNALPSYAPDWSPDGRAIAFQRWTGTTHDLCTMYADGSGETNLTNHASYDYSPAWSPDGTTIAFATRRYTELEIATISERSRTVSRLTNDTFSDDDPAWHPLGTQLAYTCWDGPGSEIVTMDPTGGNQRNLSRDPYDDMAPRYSSDGRYIAFYSNRVNATGLEVWIQETESPYRAWQVTSHQPMRHDKDPDLGSPTLQTDRVLIGGTGTDRFGNDPVYPTAPALIVAYGDEGYRNLVRIGVASSHLGSLQIKPLPNAGSASVAVEVSATKVANLRQDAGLGMPPTLWDFNALNAGMAILHFNGSTGKLVSATVVKDVAYPTAAGADKPAYTCAVQGDSLLLSGDFAAVFDAEGRNLAPGGAKTVTLGKEGQVLSVN